MEISALQNNKQTNFKQLSIRNMDFWDGQFLYDFVRNNEIKKLTRFLHENQVDLLANLKKNKVSLKAGTEEYEDITFYTIYANKEALQKFNADAAISEYQRVMDDIEKENLLHETAEEILDSFNKSLEKEEETPKTIIRKNNKNGFVDDDKPTFWERIFRRNI